MLSFVLWDLGWATEIKNKGKVDGSGGDDAFGNLGNSNLMIDHCSISWSSDEAMTIYRGDNVSIQWCFITEPLNYSTILKLEIPIMKQHGYGGIWVVSMALFTTIYLHIVGAVHPDLLG